MRWCREAWIRVTNKRRRPITVQVKDTLYCDAGAGRPGAGRR